MCDSASQNFCTMIVRSFRQRDPVCLEPWLVIRLFTCIPTIVGEIISVFQSVGRWLDDANDNVRETGADSQARRPGRLSVGIVLLAGIIVGTSATVVFMEAHIISVVFSFKALLEKEEMASLAAGWPASWRSPKEGIIRENPTNYSFY